MTIVNSRPRTGPGRTDEQISAGFEEKPEIERFTLKIKVKILCPTCDGHGHLSVETACGRCDGAGTIEKEVTPEEARQLESENAMLR